MSNKTKLGVAALLCSVAALSACSGQSSGSGTTSGGSSQSAGAQGGGASTGDDATKVVSDAYAKTIAAKTASFTTETDTNQGGKDVKISGNGKVQFDPPAADYSVKILNRPAQIRLVSGKLYINLTGKWSEAPASESSQLANLSPAQSLDMLKNSVTSAKKTDTKQVNGASATGYHVTIDLNKLTQSTSNDALKKSMQMLQQQLKTSTLPVDLYLDDQGRLVEQDQSLSLQVQGKQIMTKTMSTYTGFGAPVNITAPKIG